MYNWVDDLWTICYSLVPFKWFCVVGERLLAGLFSAFRIVKSFMKWWLSACVIAGRFGLPQGLCTSCWSIDWREKTNAIWIIRKWLLLRSDIVGDRSIKIINAAERKERVQIESLTIHQQYCTTLPRSIHSTTSKRRYDEGSRYCNERALAIANLCPLMHMCHLRFEDNILKMNLLISLPLPTPPATNTRLVILALAAVLMRVIMSSRSGTGSNGESGVKSK